MIDFFRVLAFLLLIVFSFANLNDGRYRRSSMWVGAFGIFSAFFLAGWWWL